MMLLAHAAAGSTNPNATISTSFGMDAARNAIAGLRLAGMSTMTSPMRQAARPRSATAGRFALTAI